METNLIGKAERILDGYLEGENQRKTPERYAILRAVYSIGKRFCIMCGKVTEIGIPSFVAILDGMRLKHFRKDCFTLYLYRTRRVCLGKQTKIKTFDKENLKIISYEFRKS